VLVASQASMSSVVLLPWSWSINYNVAMTFINNNNNNNNILQSCNVFRSYGTQLNQLLFKSLYNQHWCFYGVAMQPCSILACDFTWFYRHYKKPGQTPGLSHWPDMWPDLTRPKSLTRWPLTRFQHWSVRLLSIPSRLPGQGTGQQREVNFKSAAWGKPFEQSIAE